LHAVVTVEIIVNQLQGRLFGALKRIAVASSTMCLRTGNIC